MPEPQPTYSPILACFVSEDRLNTFPALPVRLGEHVFICFAGFLDLAAHQRHLAALAKSPAWNESIANTLASAQIKAPERLRLAPTTRSLLTGRTSS